MHFVVNAITVVTLMAVGLAVFVHGLMRAAGEGSATARELERQGILPPGEDLSD